MFFSISVLSSCNLNYQLIIYLMHKHLDWVSGRVSTANHLRGIHLTWVDLKMDIKVFVTVIQLQCCSSHSIFNFFQMD